MPIRKAGKRMEKIMQNEIEITEFIKQLILLTCEYYEISDLDSESFTNTITTLIKVEKYINDKMKGIK